MVRYLGPFLEDQVGSLDKKALPTVATAPFEKA